MRRGGREEERESLQGKVQSAALATLQSPNRPLEKICPSPDKGFVESAASPRRHAFPPECFGSIHPAAIASGASNRHAEVAAALGKHSQSKSSSR